MNPPDPRPGVVNILGAGLIGGSIGFGLRTKGWTVTVTDIDPSVERLAIEREAAHRVGLDPQADLTVVGAPVGEIPGLVRRALAETSGIVTDVGSTKAEICRTIDDERFVGGHPMAGSEQDGIEGARADLFVQAMWVLTPGERISEHGFTMLRSLIRALGAECIVLPAETHDELVAQVSHVPHLTAASLMNLAASTSVEHRALLRLAAGGFRDMTRVSAGRPAIWPDICVANKEAIVGGLTRLIDELSHTRRLVSEGNRTGLYELLDKARTARINLPVGYGHVEKVALLKVPMPDRPGEIAAITTLAAELDVNILDLNITHSGEGREGVMTLVVDASLGERLVGGLMARGYRPTLREHD